MKKYYALLDNNNKALSIRLLDTEQAQLEKNLIQVDNPNNCYNKIYNKEIKKWEQIEDIEYIGYSVKEIIDADLPEPAINEPVELTQSDRIEASILRLEVKIDELLEKLSK